MAPNHAQDSRPVLREAESKNNVCFADGAIVDIAIQSFSLEEFKVIPTDC